MAKILTLDTSTDACSVALWLDGSVYEDFRVIPRQHTKELLPMISRLMAEQSLKISDLDAIAFGRGPGSFAGIRIATGTAQGLAFAANLPMLPVSTLAAMALQQHRQNGEKLICASLDARMNEIYTCGYQFNDGHPVAVTKERVCAPVDVVLPDGEWNGVGKGWSYLEDMTDALKNSVVSTNLECYPNAGAMAELAATDYALGLQVAPELAMPVYLRDEVAWKKKDQQ